MGTEQNVKKWNEHYRDIRRQRHCDLNFLHLLYRYALKSTDENPKYALVIGCGDGAESIELSRLGFNTTAIDISASAIERLNKFAIDDGVNVKALVHDQRKVIDLPDTFDIIVSWSTLSYLDESEINCVLHELSQKMKPEGSIVALFESNASSICESIYSQKVDKNTYQISANSPVNPGLTMTCFDKCSIDSLIKDYLNIRAYAYRDFYIPAVENFKISQHMYVLGRRI
jgi:SAM-dependent methyltransferase